MESDSSLSISEDSGEETTSKQRNTPLASFEDDDATKKALSVFAPQAKYPYPASVILGPVSMCGRSFWRLGALNIYMLACAFLTLFMAFSTIQVRIASFSALLISRRSKDR